MGARGLDKRGSFFKLIDTIASEIGELKQEMVQTDVGLGDGLEPAEAHRHLNFTPSQFLLAPAPGNLKLPVPYPPPHHDGNKGAAGFSV